MLLTLQVIVFGFAWWFGLYLLVRDLRKPALRFAGLGLIAYALGIGLDAIPASDLLMRVRWALLFVPGVFWFGATIHMLPERERVNTLYNSGWLPALVLLFTLAFTADIQSSILQISLTLIIGAVLVGGFVLALQATRLPSRPRGVLIVATLFFGLGMGLLILPDMPIPREVSILALGVDLLMLGLAAAALDAFNEGEALRRDIFRSFSYAGFAALVFGGQVVLVGDTSPTLLLVIVASAITFVVLADPLQALFDRLVLSPKQQHERADLRAVASASARVNDEIDVIAMDDAEFNRFTRRALSAFGDLNKLAASPLTRLPVIDARLAERGAPDNTLERAAELKSLLAESINRLKPRMDGDFGTSDEWRHYNALYFPYVAGLKPYSRSYDDNDYDTTTRAALEWLQINVPERTLHNWQNAAAKLVAQDLRELAADGSDLRRNGSTESRMV